MSGTPIDWTHGPIPCRACGKSLRPRTIRPAEAVGVWAGTVRHESGGMCGACRQRIGPGKPPRPAPQAVQATERRTRHSASTRPQMVGSPTVGTPLTLVWEALDADLPLAHQEMEAMAELADHLRARGLVLCARPSLRLTHGRPATITMSCRVRSMRDGEDRVLSHPVRAAS